MGFHALLQGIFPTQGWNLSLLCFLHCRQILYQWATSQAPWTTVLHNSWLTESLDEEPWIWRSHSRTLWGFLTVGRVYIPNLHIVQGFNCIYKYFCAYTHTHTHAHDYTENKFSNYNHSKDTKHLFVKSHNILWFPLASVEYIIYSSTVNVSKPSFSKHLTFYSSSENHTHFSYLIPFWNFSCQNHFIFNNNLEYTLTVGKNEFQRSLADNNFIGVKKAEYIVGNA